MVRPVPTIAWLEAGQIPLLRQIAEATGLAIVAAGGPEATAGQSVAQSLSAKPIGDLRSAIATATSGLIFIGAPGTFASAGTTSRSDAEELDAARDRGVKIISLEPLPASLVQLSEIGHAGGAASATAGLPGAWCEHGPILRLAQRMQELPELLAHIGPVRSAHLCVMGTRATGSLGARLVDAVDLAHTLVGVPSSVFASFTGASTSVSGIGGASPLHILPGQTLRDLHGDIAMTFRTPTGQGVSILVSDQAARFGVQLTVIGAAGRLSIIDDHLHWLTPDGQVAESASEGGDWVPWGKVDHADPSAFYVRLLSRQLDQYLSSGAGLSARIDYPRVLATAQAALLSARTGEAESPATMLRLAGA